MAFPASSVLLEAAYRNVKQKALDVRSNAVAMRSAAQAGTNGQRIVLFSSTLAQLRSQMAAIVATPGLGVYAQQQENNPALNIVTEYNAMDAQIASTLAWISANFPKDASGYLLTVQLAADGTLVWRDFTPAALAGFVTVLDSLIATIS